jgi:hypothetical protein
MPEFWAYESWSGQPSRPVTRRRSGRLLTRSRRYPRAGPTTSLLAYVPWPGQAHRQNRPGRRCIASLRIRLRSAVESIPFLHLRPRGSELPCCSRLSFETNLFANRLGEAFEQPAMFCEDTKYGRYVRFDMLKAFGSRAFGLRQTAEK